MSLVVAPTVFDRLGDHVTDLGRFQPPARLRRFLGPASVCLSPELVPHSDGWHRRFLEDHIGWTIGTAVSLLVISVAFTAWMLVKLPHDHFAVPRPPDPNVLVRIAKNVGGVLLILLGIVLSLPGVPGQGFLTILIGLMLTDIPGKRRVELFVLRRASVHAAITKLRARYGREPLVLPGRPVASEVDDEAAASSPGSAPGSALSRADAEAPASGGASSTFAGTTSKAVTGGAAAGSTRA